MPASPALKGLRPLSRDGLGIVMLASSQELVDVIDRVAKGDSAAFETLYRATSAKLYGIIVRIVINRSSADEILQEVYVKVWQRAGEFDGRKASAITWMATIARNRAIDEIRRAKPHEVQDITEGMDFAADLPHPLEGRQHSESLRSLIDCLKALPDERREIILLAYCRGLSREALGRRFDHPVPTIKTWLHRGLAQLKTCMSS